jgi:hypothetical protein
MIRHVVLWMLKPEFKQRQELPDARHLEASLAAMRKGIAGLLHIELKRNAIEAPDNADLVLYSEFDSWQALDRYQTHPLHEHFKKLIAPLRTERRTADFEV